MTRASSSCLHQLGSGNVRQLIYMCRVPASASEEFVPRTRDDGIACYTPIVAKKAKLTRPNGLYKSQG